MVPTLVTQPRDISKFPRLPYIKRREKSEKSKIALKPYLDIITGYCNTLSNEELTNILICLARDIPTSGRVNFLEKIESYLPGRRPAIIPEAGPVEQILDDIEALKESIEERVKSIEDGSYWDDPDVWEDDGYYEEEPDDISEGQEEELGSFFDDAERLFLDDRLEDARKVYEALFSLIRNIKEKAYFSHPDEIDIREARARYCRCVYETSNADKRLDEFIEAMEVDVFKLYHENEYDEDYPLMQDVIDAKHVLLGKREGFFSYMSDQNLLDLVAESTIQGKRDNELDTVIKFFKARNSINEEKDLYARALLMAGKLNEAVAMAKNEKSVGWSFGSNAGVVFGSVLSVLAGHSEKAGTIKTLLSGYANNISVYSERFSIDDGKGTSFYDEIINGLKQKKDANSQATKSLSWAEKIGKMRIDHIVSNKHRRAYERAAQVLGSLAEVYAAMGQKNKATKILHKYYNEKYNRFSAFRREVKAVVKNSDILRNSGFLN